jgi:hypothetical protein
MELNEETASYGIKKFGLQMYPGDITQYQLPVTSLDAIL